LRTTIWRPDEFSGRAGAPPLRSARSLAGAGPLRSRRTMTERARSSVLCRVAMAWGERGSYASAPQLARQKPAAGCRTPVWRAYAAARGAARA
jgi:hypothetical protein